MHCFLAAYMLLLTKQTTHSMHGALLAQPERDCPAISLAMKPKVEDEQ
jgi:hypothetical protein